MKPRKHAEVIRAWLDGADIEYRTAPSELWRSVDDPHFDHEFEYRVKFQRAYPETRMTHDELMAVWQNSFGSAEEAWRALTNAAIKHACQNDQVVPMAEVREVARNLNKREIGRLKELLAKAERSLEMIGYKDCGGEFWKPPVGPLLDYHAAREMAVAEAVMSECKARVKGYSGGLHDHLVSCFSGDRLAAIIAGVRP